MIKEAIEKIVSLSKYEAQSVNGRSYLFRDNGTESLASPESIAKPLEFHSLSGLVDYVASSFDLVIGSKRAALVIDGPDSVRFVRPLTDEFRQREVLATAAPYLSPGFTFGQFIDTEKFVVALQTCFESDEQTAAILRVVGNVASEAVQTFCDDGVTQQVTAKAGIARKADVAVPNPVTLRPFRTFPEVAQPSTRYVLRLRRGNEGELPMAALFEVVDNRWKHDAVTAIELHLNGLLEGAGIMIPVFA